ncbi:putative Pentatricopeptide repeat domain containing protein [Klebsormidium nitens]|uniref:Putative Pentatricopeptide repeat domain containing protein n=1 Tax=Klebsormidium nitens TaxID=105231 RepID=A0A1Y1I3R5_KLENI|nr:putative Pentatricopeptide repeat domain containing protein [Klebsormidium nitens]|eukprot:GAQ83821.1 putative Pentatricopeptide repeat domain containing protein [Klebsormidium nitens]
MKASQAGHPNFHNATHRTCRGLCNPPPSSSVRRSCFRKETRSQKRGRLTVATLALDREQVTDVVANSERAESRLTEKPRAVVRDKRQRNRTGRLVDGPEGRNSGSADLQNVVSSDPFLGPGGLEFKVPSARHESSGLASTSGSNGVPSSRRRGSNNGRALREGYHRSGKEVPPNSSNVADELGLKGSSMNGARGGDVIGARKSVLRRRAFAEVEPLQDEALRRAVDEAFPLADITSSADGHLLPLQNLVNGVVNVNPEPSIDPSLLLDALTQPPSILREIAAKGEGSSTLPAAPLTPSSETLSNATPSQVVQSSPSVKTPLSADAVERARAALLDPAVIANWDKIVVSDWDPLPVSLIPFRGGFADRRGVVRSAQNPPKPHPLTSLSALYKDVVALFDPAGVDSLLDLRRDEGLLTRPELLELIKRLGEAGASVKKPLAVFRWMQRQEDVTLRPTEASYSVMVRLLGKLNAADAAVGLIREMEASGLERNVQTYNALLSGLAKRGKFDECWHLFQQMRNRGPVPEVWTYNNLITAAAWCLPGREALKQGLFLLAEMQKQGLRPNVFTYNALMQTGVKARDLAEVKRLFEELRERDCRPDLVTFNTVVKACLDKRDWEGVFEYFKAMPAAECVPDATTYDCIILAYTQQQRFDEALSMLDQMREAGCRPDLRTYNSLLHSCAEAGEGDRARGLLRSMLRLAMKPTIFHWCSLMNAFAKAGRCDDAASVFRDMQAAKVVPTIYAYNILLDAYCRAGRFTTAEGLLRIMQKSPCKPNIVSYNTLIGAYARAKDLEQVKLVFREMLKGGYSPNSQTQRVVSQVFLDAKKEREATRLFWEAKQAEKRRRRMQVKQLELLSRVVDQGVD